MTGAVDAGMPGEDMVRRRYAARGLGYEVGLGRAMSDEDGLMR